MAGLFRLWLATSFTFNRLTGNVRVRPLSRLSRPRKSLAMNTEDTTSATREHWKVCPCCHGEGKRTRPPTRKARLRHKRAKTAAGANPDISNNKDNSAPMRIDPCSQCNQTGLVATMEPTLPNPKYPSVAIIGGGLGGLALAIACHHRQIPYRVYERDASFSERSQGYGLTMQQASRALSAFGISSLNSHGMTSTKHVVHHIDGTVVGEWGLRKWGRDSSKRPPKRQNIHIARQALRQELLDRVDPANISWGTKLIRIVTAKTYRDDKNDKASTIQLEFQQDQQLITHDANLVVGSDGIRSTVRQYLVSDDQTPLRYLDCLVVLGICPLDALPESTQQSELLDGATVFQTADGSTRIYCMPFSQTQYMWQLSFPMDEQQAKETSRQGPRALKEQALAMCDQWHSPVCEILQQTPVEMVSGYPVYDRDLLTMDMLNDNTKLPITLIGDAAHPMSPFKGQGANQALLDALVLARAIYASCHPSDHSDKPSSEAEESSTSTTDAIHKYHKEMTARSAKKVQASAQAAQFLHTDVAIQKGNVTRGAAAAAAATNSH